MKRRILVVEDDRTLRQALTFNLGREDYEVRVAVDGEQALAAGRDPSTSTSSCWTSCCPP